MATLGVNIDHVATVREARKTIEPDPAWAAALAELAGADGITLHLREDRRHIQDRDLRVILETVAVPVNLELACVDEVLAIACESKLTDAVLQLNEAGVLVSLFIDADLVQIEASASIHHGAGVDGIELHTGPYAHAFAAGDSSSELERLATAGEAARAAGLRLHAGHGLNYHNVKPVAAIEGMAELNIGHSLISRAVLVGMERATREMKRLIVEANHS